MIVSITFEPERNEDTIAAGMIDNLMKKITPKAIREEECPEGSRYKQIHYFVSVNNIRSGEIDKLHS